MVELWRRRYVFLPQNYKLEITLLLACSGFDRIGYHRIVIYRVLSKVIKWLCSRVLDHRGSANPARRLFNEGFQPAIILEVILYDWSRGSGYSGSYTAPGTSSSGSAERRAEAEEIGIATGSNGRGERENAVGGIVPIVTMDVCPCPPATLFRDGDIYEEEEDEESGDGMRLALVRRDGKAVGAAPGAVGERSGPVSGGIGFSDLFTADDLACDVGGLDSQLEDIVRRVLSTRSIPAEVTCV